ncbi:MAG: 4-(cytidine 5'-diphospho)-2-C-methyl-D-erythritol kinase [Oscillospiraceae bacterium]
MKVKAAAKINLMLDVLGVLPSGYHSLFMIMQSVSCYDEITVSRTKTNKIVILTDDKKIPTDEKNIAYKAAKAFFDYNNIIDIGIEIKIDKAIPIAAGLAGGSADGAGVIFILDKLYKTNLQTSVLCKIGEKVGADVPFSLTGGTSLCMNTGGVIAPLPAIKDCYIVLCKPPMEVSTNNAYKAIDEAKRIRHTDKNAMLYAMANGDYEIMCKAINNVFEQVIEVPKRPYIKTIMRKCGADATCMSGSGPTVYGIFSSYDNAQKCETELKKHFDEVCFTIPIKCGIEVIK